LSDDRKTIELFEGGCGLFKSTADYSMSLDGRLSELQRSVEELRSVVSGLREDVDSLKRQFVPKVRHDVRCLKYEVRRLRAHPPSSLEPNSGPSSSDDKSRQTIAQLLEDVAALKSVSAGLRPQGPSPPAATTGPGVGGGLRGPIPQEIVDAVTELRAEISEIRIANRPGASPDRDVIVKLQQDFAALSGALEGAPIDRMRHDIKCLKFEIKRLFAVRPGEAGGRSPGIDNLIAAVTEEVTTDIRQDVRRQLRCVKHELRGLRKSGGWARQPEWSGAVDDGPAIPSGGQIAEELNAIKRDIDELRSCTGLVGAPQISQVFVDLPDAAAVQLAFRAKQFSSYT
jgi:hypothetical protein